MAVFVLVRHGESRWNLSNRFTGWVDVPLSENGIKEAERVAVHCKQFDYSVAFTSLLARAQATLLIILSRQNKTGIFQHTESPRYLKWVRSPNKLKEDMPIYANVALNERYYGELQGMNKLAVLKKYGEKKVIAWRRGYTDKPPSGESLKETHARVHKYLVRNILPKVRRGKNVLLVAHGNTLRAIIKHLEKISDKNISLVDLPDARPLVYKFIHSRFVRVEGSYHFERPLR